MHDITEKLITLRKKNGFTQIELAKHTGLGLYYIRKFESGERIPNLKQLQLIADVLNVDASVFLTSSRQNILLECEKLCNSYSKMMSLSVTKSGREIIEDINTNKFDKGKIYVGLDSSLLTQLLLSANKIRDCLEDL